MIWKLASLMLVFTLGVLLTAPRAALHGARRVSTTTLPVPAKALTGEQQTHTIYPIHEDITATTFWVGEDATGANAFIHNHASSWDEQWLDHFGGVDDPDNRQGYLPADFTPKENPFYFALPYTDFDKEGRKANAGNIIPWAGARKWMNNESMCKNRWIKITRGDKTAYAQWEDSGPFQSDDVAYVFGDAQPRNRINNHAGLDVSPAVRDYLDLNGKEKVSWQFVDDADVPTGPWKQIVTTSQTSWD